MAFSWWRLYGLLFMLAAIRAVAVSIIVYIVLVASGEG